MFKLLRSKSVGIKTYNYFHYIKKSKRFLTTENTQNVVSSADVVIIGKL